MTIVATYSYYLAENSSGSFRTFILTRLLNQYIIYHYTTTRAWLLVLISTMKLYDDNATSRYNSLEPPTASSHAHAHSHWLSINPVVNAAANTPRYSQPASDWPHYWNFIRHCFMHQVSYHHYTRISGIKWYILSRNFANIYFEFHAITHSQLRASALSRA
jgi:hypothetical protein